MIGNDEMKPIFLYGMNTKAKYANKLLKQRNENVVGIIDQRCAGKMKYDDIPVFSFEKIFTYDSKKIVIIICLQDGVKQQEVAEKIYSYDITNIIFFPMKTVINQNYTYFLRKKYLSFWDGQNVCLENNFTYEGNQWKNQDYNIGTNRLIFCPKELIFVEKKVCDDYYNPRGNESDSVSQYDNKNVICLDYYFELWKYLIEGNGAIEKYLILKNYDIVFLENRRKLLEYYMNAFESTSDSFFELSAPLVKWNEKGLFYIADGLHRVTFQIYMKKDFIPVRISKADYHYLFENTKYLHLLQEKKQPYIFPKQEYSDIKYEVYTSCLNKIRLHIFDSYKTVNSVLEISEVNGFFVKELIKSDIKEGYYYSDNSEGCIPNNATGFTRKITSNLSVIYNDDLHCMTRLHNSYDIVIIDCLINLSFFSNLYDYHDVFVLIKRSQWINKRDEVIFAGYSFFEELNGNYNNDFFCLIHFRK